MNAMVNSPDAPGDDPCTVTGIRATDEPGEELAELEITVGCSPASLRKDCPASTPGPGSSVIGCAAARPGSRGAGPWRSGRTGQILGPPEQRIAGDHRKLLSAVLRWREGW